MYKDNDNEDEPSTIDDVVENIIEEVHSVTLIPPNPTCNVGKLNLEVLKKEQQWDRFCKRKVRDMKKKPDPNFLLDHNIILRKEIKLKYTMEPAIGVPRKLTSLTIIEFHNAKGHQGSSRMVNMIRHYFWWISMWRDVHQCISACKLHIQFLPSRMYTQPVHLEISHVPFAGFAMDCTGPLPTT